MPVVSQCPLKHSGSGKTHVVRSGVELLAGMHSYGAKQQGASPANVDFSRAMVDAFCPQWPELLGADGGVWDLRTELSFAEYERTVRAMADKACGADGMQLGFLRMLSREQLYVYWQLLISCAEAATFPEAWDIVTASSSRRSRARPCAYRTSATYGCSASAPRR